MGLSAAACAASLGAQVERTSAATVIAAARERVAPCPLGQPVKRRGGRVFCRKRHRRVAHDRDSGRSRRPAAAQPRRGSGGPAPNAPSAPGATPPELREGNPDPFRSLGASSPFCRRPGLRARPGCRIAGSIAHTYPASNYGLDIQIETRIDRVENNLFAALQSVAALCWLGLVYALKGVLLLLEWAFSLDLLNEAMSSVRRTLERLHERVLGRPWFMAAIALAGLWGVWRGLVQRRTIETAAGLLATVLLMVAALVVIRDPAGTVGYASRLANDASLGFMSAASRGSVDRPAEGFAGSEERLFNALVLRPWCALEFGDLRYCTRRRREGFRNADLWLAFPADGKEREALYKLTKGEDPGGGGFFDDLKHTVGGVLSHGPAGLSDALLGLTERSKRGGELPDGVRGLVRKDPGKVKMQEKDGTFTRIALLCLIALGLLGAICLLLYLAVKLVLAGLLALLLLLLAPAMLLAPAFGDSGRATFLAWALRLGGAIAAKLIYALLLALVVVAATALASLPVGWFGTWLLQIAFWWGILIKRHELTGFVSVGQQGEERSGRSGFLRAYQNARAARAVGEGATAAAAALPLLATRRATQQRADRSEATRRAVAISGREQLDRSAERARELELAEARSLLEARPQLERTRAALSRRLAPFETQLAEALARREQPRPPTDDEWALIASRARAEARLASDCHEEGPPLVTRSVVFINRVPRRPPFNVARWIRPESKEARRLPAVR